MHWEGQFRFRVVTSITKQIDRHSVEDRSSSPQKKINTETQSMTGGIIAQKKARNLNI